MNWSHEERRQKLMEMTDRSPELNASAGSDIFRMEFVDYTDDNEYIVKYYICLLYTSKGFAYAREHSVESRFRILFRASRLLSHRCDQFCFVHKNNPPQ